MNIFKKLKEILVKTINILLCILMVCLVIVVFSNAISRYFLNISIPWADEASRFMFIWVSFLGAILAFQSKEHMKFTLVINSVSKRWAYIFKAIASLVTLGILLLLIIGGVTLVTKNMDWFTPALEIPYGIVYLIVPISCVILALLATISVGNNIKSLIGGKK